MFLSLVQPKPPLHGDPSVRVGTDTISLSESPDRAKARREPYRHLHVSQKSIPQMTDKSRIIVGQGSGDATFPVVHSPTRRKAMPTELSCSYPVQ